jgi:hypothetical protein
LSVCSCCFFFSLLPLTSLFVFQEVSNKTLQCTTTTTSNQVKKTQTFKLVVTGRATLEGFSNSLSFSSMSRLT